MDIASATTGAAGYRDVEVDRQPGPPGRTEVRTVKLHHGAYLLCVLGVYPLCYGADKPNRCSGLVIALVLQKRDSLHT